MILPFTVTSLNESMSQIRDRHLADSQALGIDDCYFIRWVVLPQLPLPAMTAVMLGLARAIGETMAVMLVIGNSPIWPRLLGRAQTIPSLITLEMGMAEVGSLRYSALFLAGLVLLILILLIHAGVQVLQNRLSAR